MVLFRRKHKKQELFPSTIVHQSQKYFGDDTLWGGVVKYSYVQALNMSISVIVRGFILVLIGVFTLNSLSNNSREESGEYKPLNNGRKQDVLRCHERFSPKECCRGIELFSRQISILTLTASHGTSTFGACRKCKIYEVNTILINGSVNAHLLCFQLRCPRGRRILGYKVVANFLAGCLCASILRCPAWLHFVN